MEFELGATLKDLISGFQGIATGRVSYITGCDQYLLQPQSKDGDKKEAIWFDVNRLTQVGKKKIILKTSEENGADISAPIK
jgi:hypothetical protein